MEKIINKNFDGICMVEFCSMPYEYYMKSPIAGFKIILGFCKEHADKIEESLIMFPQITKEQFQRGQEEYNKYLELTKYQQAILKIMFNEGIRKQNDISKRLIEKGFVSSAIKVSINILRMKKKGVIKC
jgi:site-specific recombinase